MNSKKITIAIVVIILVAVVGGYLLMKQPPSGKKSEAGQTGAAGGGGTQLTAPVTRETAPAKIGGWEVSVPGKDSANVPENVAKPEVVGVGNPAGTTSYRSFSIKAEGDKFSPDTIVVKEKDTVRLSINAIDKDYDFTQPDYGFKVAVKKGDSKPLQFDASASGKFLFYCAACGGPNKGPIGYLIVTAQ
ncbi:MAG: cupredoxin domain-containing protein [Patescibacteria group bacterium]